MTTSSISFKFFVIASLFVAAYYISNVETCGNISKTNDTARKRRSAINAEIELSTTLDFPKTVGSNKARSEENELFSKIEQLLGADYYDLIMDSQTRTKSFEEDGKIVLKYNMYDVNCEDVKDFTEAAKNAISTIQSAKIQCDGDIFDI